MYIRDGYTGASMSHSTLFNSNKTQAVRLLKQVAFPQHIKRVVVTKIGNSRLISPAGGSWDTYFDGPGVSEDFMLERNQAMAQRRRGFADA